MDLNVIRSELRLLSELADGWAASGNIASLERDMMLGKLRSLYELVRFGEAGGVVAADPAGEVVQPVAVEDAVPEYAVGPAGNEEVGAVGEAIDLGEVLSLDASLDDAEPAAAPVEEPVAAPESDAESASDAEPALAPVEEPVAAPESDPEPAPAEEPAPEPEPERPVAFDTLFGPDEEPVDRHRHKQRLIMSLYDTASSARSSKPATSLSEELTMSVAELTVGDAGTLYSGEEVAEASIAGLPAVSDTEVSDAVVASMGDSAPVLGDVIGHDRQTLADTIAPPHDIASELRRGEPVGDLHCAIGINDKFLMIRDLFGGDAGAFDRAIGELNACTDLDDCMIHIAENYAWNPDSDGAKLLMELLERKFA